jgi:hypothetical protein
LVMNAEKAFVIGKAVEGGLRALLEMQKEVSGAFGAIPEGDGPPGKRDFAEAALALFVEWGEFVNALEVKPWKKASRSRGAVVGEFADVLAFLGLSLVLLDRAGMGPEALAAAYVAKSSVNLERAAGAVAGYVPEIKKGGAG